MYCLYILNHMQNFIVGVLIACILLFPIYSYAAPREADLVLENIQIEPSYPKKGELVTITGEVYNAGLKNTDSFASIITVAYFVDGELLHINAIDNVEPGLSNKIKISSPPIWKSEIGSHNVKVIIDYHNSIQDQYDYSNDNSLERTFFIEPSKNAQILLYATPQYFIQGQEMPDITISLLDSNSKEPLNNKEIILTLDNINSTLTTNHEGKIYFSNAIPIYDSIKITVFFEGDSQYSSSSSSLTLNPFPKDVTSSSFIIQILDSHNQYNFEDYSFDIVIFQNSYGNLITKIKPDSTTLLDSKTFHVSLPPTNTYFAEIYLEDRLLFVTSNDLLEEDTILFKELKIPETASIRFKVTDGENSPIAGVLVKNWIYHTNSNEDGFTEWIDILPTTYNEPYVAEVVLPDQSVIKSDPFFVFSEEQKTIEIITNDSASVHNIPSWIKNNAGWWATGQIDDVSFIQGIQFLIKEGIMMIPPTTQGEGAGSNEIPTWIKNNAGWWANGDIDDNSFIQGIQFLINEGIMEIH